MRHVFTLALANCRGLLQLVLDTTSNGLSSLFTNQSIPPSFEPLQFWHVLDASRIAVSKKRLWTARFLNCKLIGLLVKLTIKTSLLWEKQRFHGFHKLVRHSWDTMRWMLLSACIESLKRPFLAVPEQQVENVGFPLENGEYAHKQGSRVSSAFDNVFQYLTICCSAGPPYHFHLKASYI